MKDNHSPIAHYITTLINFVAKKKAHRDFKYEPICKTTFGKNILVKLDKGDVDSLQDTTPWQVDGWLDDEVENLPQTNTKGSPKQLLGKQWAEDLEGIIEALRN
jgi:hypothetical protein